MSLEAELQSLVRENEGDLLSFARKLYEHGYRQGLASRPQDLASRPQDLASRPQDQSQPEPPGLAAIAPPPTPAQGPLFPSRPSLVDGPDDADADSDSDEQADPGPEADATTCDHRVRSSITLAGLQKKIERIFDLSRFDIDVVICRRGDSERRRLKGTVKLKNYLLEGE
jgi:hypothetical protein